MKSPLYHNRPVHLYTPRYHKVLVCKKTRDLQCVVLLDSAIWSYFRLEVSNLANLAINRLHVSRYYFGQSDDVTTSRHCGTTQSLSAQTDAKRQWFNLIGTLRSTYLLQCKYTSTLVDKCIMSLYLKEKSGRPILCMVH